MSIIAKKNKREFSPAPEGLHSAVCCDVVDLGMQQSPWGEAHKVEIRWQLEEKDPKSDRPYMVVSRYTLSLHEKSRLRPMLEAWRGRKFNNDELDGFDLEALVGVNCQIQVCHNIKDDGEVFANVQAVVGPERNSVKLRVNPDYIRVQDRDQQRNAGHPETGYQAQDEDTPF